MKKQKHPTITESELDVLVSIAIRRAEFLDDERSSAAPDSWFEVMLYEEKIAEVTSPSDIPGGIARVGAVRAALAAGQRVKALSLASQYLDEDLLPSERKTAIKQTLQEDQEITARRFPSLAKTGRLAELDEWIVAALKSTRVFPLAA